MTSQTTRPGGYAAVPASVDLPALEHAVLQLWRDSKTFEKSREQTAHGESWVFFEGPPTANGMPGVHHVEARTFKDVYPRYWTMRGRSVLRKGGWDCHGLPVEIAVEKELGFTGKAEIEAYGVAAFNDRCRASVQRYVAAWEAMSDRMGYWVDMSDPYRTMDPEYVDSLWWALKQIHDKGLLVEDHRVAPYCPRCGTGLSDHELAQGYETVVDPSVYVRFPVTGGPLQEQYGDLSLVVWTTTPWTLVSNTAVAVHPEVDYVVARTAGSSDSASEVVVVAEPLLQNVVGEAAEVLTRVRGRDLERTPYRRPFDLVDIPDAHFVVLADYVTTEDGSGLVHQSPAFGADDLATCRRYDLPVVNPVRKDGTFEPDVPLVGGMFFKAADTPLVADLRARGLLLKHLDYEHSYPHCWRCHTALIYYAQPSWYIRTTQAKDALLRENERTQWVPENVQWGRYGDWLRNNIDWALSRNRYWGTPLPLWRCGAGHVTAVGSRAELGERAGRDLSALDPHRPYVDEVTFACPADTGEGLTCGVEAVRVPEVADAWFDSGAMPFAQWGYPHVPGSTERFLRAYPAQFICEAIDQTRGWFYTLMAVGTLVFDRSSYETVVCLGHILAEDGRKMSKHLGNVLEPISLMDQHGADALRWFMAASGSPWLPRRVGHATLQEIVRKVLLTYWNTVSFHTLYARTAGWTPADGAPPAAERPVLDRWALSEAHRLVRDAGAAYEAFDVTRVCGLVAQFVDDLSNWYVRRSRRRFWSGDPAALATLHECLDLVTRVMAPVTPFVTERVWQDVVRTVTPDAAESVHLSTWPASDASLVSDELSDQVALVRRLVELGRAARAQSKVRTRQPLGRALVAAPGWEALSPELRAQVADELNVGTLEGLGGAGDLVEVSAKANFRALGKRFGKGTPAVAAAIAAADAAELSSRLRAAGEAVVMTPEGEVTVSADEVVVTEVPREGWAVASDGGESLALDLTLTPELVRAGLAREVVRLVQEARKSSGFDVSDRITLWWQASGELAEAVQEHATLIGEEVLAPQVVAVDTGDPAPDGLPVHRDEELGLAFWVARV